MAVKKIQLKLERFCQCLEQGTFGVLMAPEFRCFTVERPWAENKSYISCIPSGTYRLTKGRYNKMQIDAPELIMPVDSPRSMIKIHPANTMDDIQGCIGPGNQLGFVNGKWAVTNSRKAFDELMDILNKYWDERYEIDLMITNQKFF